MTGTREQAAFTSGQKTGRAHTAVAAAAVTALAAAALAAPWGAARAETIPAEIFVLHDSWDASRTAAGAADPVLRVTGPGRVRAVSAGAAEGRPGAEGAAGSPVLVPTVKVAKHTLPFPEQLALQPAALYQELLFTPTAGGPAVALRLFLPAPAGEREGGLAPFGNAAPDDASLLFTPIGSSIEARMTGYGLASLHQGYLAQFAPGGLENLREARCAAMQPPPSGCEAPPAGASESASLLARLGLETIPLPPAAVLLLTALTCLAAVAWRRKVPAG